MKKEESLWVTIPRLANHENEIILESEGHQTLLAMKGGKHGNLKVKLKVEAGHRWRTGDDVFSQHFLTLSDALNRCEIDVPTIESSVKIQVNPHCQNQ